VSEDGTPSVEGLWAFQQRLRQDPRWMQTRQAAMEISSTARSVMEMFGLVADMTYMMGLRRPTLSR
jgi:hypothetical protein